jgi:hypothetical protein
MSETIPSQPEKKPIVTEVDPDFYKRLCKVVKAGTFRSINFSLWHKGCDIEIDATCRWPDLKSKLDEWYFSVMDTLDLHTEADISPEYSDGKLIFVVSTTYDSFRDGCSEVTKAWDVGEFNRLVYECLPKKLRDQSEPQDLDVYLEVHYDSYGESELSNFSISLIDGESTADFSTSISKKGLEVIKKYVIGFCTQQDSSAEDVTISIECSQIETMLFYTFGEETFLLIPKP